MFFDMLNYMTGDEGLRNPKLGFKQVEEKA